MEISEIKQRLEIDTFLSHYNLTPDRNHHLKCPFHDDQDPSLKIYHSTNTFHCFGCGASGDVIEFIERYENLSKHDAIMKAKAMIDPNAEINNKPFLQDDKITLPRLAVMSKLVQESRGSFQRTASAKGYIKSRGLDPGQAEAGYMGAHLGKSWNKKLQESAMGLGILKESRKNTIVPKFKNVVLFFTRNEKGQVIDLYGRSINPNGDGKHFYLEGSHRGVYPGYPDQGTRRLILTEGIIDCETLRQQEAITREFSLMALFGVNGFTTEHEHAIKNLPDLIEVVLFFDGDKSGREATEKVFSKLQSIKADILITRVDTPDGEDINSLIQGHDPEILQELLQERSPVNKESDKRKNRDPDGQTTGTNPDPDPPEGIFDPRNPHKIIYREGDLHFTIWGGIEKENIHRLKINLLLQLEGDDYRYYQDDVNLYSNGQLQRYIRGATQELEVSTTRVKNTIRKLQIRLESYRLGLIEQERKALEPKTYRMSRQEEAKAQAFLKSKNLLINTMDLIEKSGLVGEKRNGLLLFFLYLSRMFAEPLHAIIFGKSGSGKTYLQTKISECLPEESVRTITSLTENTLYYSEKDFWKHKVLLIEDLEGVYQAFLPLREFMSKQSITKLTTDKDVKGNNVQRVLVVEGPVCVSGATTNTQIYEDNANRSFLLHVDESQDHAHQVMDYQRRQQAGLIDQAVQEDHRRLLKNVQRLLRPVRVINPYATQLDIPQCVFKKLRTNMHYLRLIEIITFYNQKQREWKKDRNGIPYIETTPDDIAWANDLIKDSFLRKSDELSGQLRQFFESLKRFAGEMPQKESIYAKQIRQSLRLHPMKVNRYLRELEQRGYIKQTGGNRKTGYEYEISAWDEYEKLKSGIDILDDILVKIREKELSITPERLSVT